MTTHLLPVSDWFVVADTELGSVLPLLTTCANDVRVMAVFDETGELAGCWAALKMTHVEGVWTAEQHRGKGGVQRALLRGMRGVLDEWGVTSAITAATDSAVKSLLMKHGAQPLPECFVLRMES